jgi:segregation and condensation protein B
VNEDQLKNIIEAALLACEEPLSIDAMAGLFSRKDGFDLPDKDAIRGCVKTLQQDYESRGVELKEVASGYRFQIRPDYAQWVNRLWEERSPRYSRALLETLAIIAYRQPVTRGEIEGIRGVSVSPGIIRNLLEREWIKVAGYRDVPGRPAVFTTTRLFLDYFNLKNLSELPILADIRDIDEVTSDLFAVPPPGPKVDSVLEPGEPQIPANDESVEDDNAPDELPDAETIPVAIVSDGEIGMDAEIEPTVPGAQSVTAEPQVDQAQEDANRTEVASQPEPERQADPERPNNVTQLPGTEPDPPAEAL